MRQLLTDLRGNPIYQSNGSWRQWRNHHHLTMAPSATGGIGAVTVRSNPFHNPRSLLFLYVTSSDWNNVVRRAQSHPQEVLMVDDNLNTPLHRACQLDPPVEVVTALQDAATQINGLGATPLHIAASHRCNGPALQTIIDLNMGALSHTSRMGRTPIHYACMSYRGLDLVAFQTLLEATLQESRNILQSQSRSHGQHVPQPQQQDEGQSNNTAIHDTSNSDGGATVLDVVLRLDGVDAGDSKPLMITDFIDVLRREHGRSRDDNGRGQHTTIDDDEDLSVLVIDDPSTGFAHMSTANDTLTFADDEDPYDEDDEDDDEENDDPNKDNPNIVTWKDSTGNTPLSLLFRRYRERVKSVISVLEEMRNNPSTGATRTTSPTSLQTDLGHLWGKARLIVARLTEEQQHLVNETTEALANQTSVRAPGTHLQQKDDSSSSGSSYNGHFTTAAAWSSERFNSARAQTFAGKDASTVSSANRTSSLTNAGHFTGRDNQNENDDRNGSADTEGDRAKQFPVQERQFRIVHASVALAGYGCPPEMIRLAISIHPNQVMEMDEDGNLPLHIAATVASLGSIREGTSIADDVSVFSDGMASMFSSGSSKRAGVTVGANYNASFEKVIKLLLKHYPQAAQIPQGKSGRLPLVLAARAGNRSWGDGMKALLRAYPPALFSGSKGLVPINLYPHVLCLIGGGPRGETTGTLASTSSLSPDSAHSVYSTASSTWSSSRHSAGGTFKGIGFLHNLLLSKQRHIRDRMALSASSTPLTSIPSASRSGRQRKPHHLLINSNSSHSQKKRCVDRKTPPTTLVASSTNVCSSKKVNPKLATTIFDVLRTKPDLVEVGRRYEAERLKKLNEQQHARTEACISNPSTEIGNEIGKRTKHKRTMSRNIFERITIFERKASKAMS